MNPTNNTEIYQGDDGQTQIEIKLDQRTLWLSTVQTAELFERDLNTIIVGSLNIYKFGHQQENPTTEKSSVVHRPIKNSGHISIVCSATPLTIRKFRTVQIDKLYSRNPSSSAPKPNMVH